MFPLVINLTDDSAVERVFTKVSQDGTDTVRREDNAVLVSRDDSKLVIKHTMDTKAKTKPNRHLIALSRNYIDDANSISESCQVHIVVTRGKNVPDSVVLTEIAMLTDLSADAAQMQLLLNGAN
jgi:hypothetical protein